MYYTRKMHQSILCSTTNLKHVRLENKILGTKNYLYNYTFMIPQITLEDAYRGLRGFHQRMQIIVRKEDILNFLRNSLAGVPRNIKDQSSNLLRVWAHQCECVIAQRLRRGQQMFCLYSKLWEERALRELINKMRQQMTRRGKEFVFGAIGIGAYDWEANRITDADMKKHFAEFKYIYMLKEKTYACKQCLPSTKINVSGSSIIPCQCADSEKVSFDNWDPFIEKPDLLVWRKLNESGSYEYKVYGSYNDVTAIDFLNVQIDTEYRKQWDNTAITLEVIDTDPDVSFDSDIVYWEMLWPKLFSNRDYVFHRRFLVDEQNKIIVIKNKGTEHPACPVKSNKYRVQDYWSYMVIKPYKELDKPGIEFGLSYYDNPGVSIPSAVTSWVAMRAMPEFLMNLREAAKKYKDYCKSHVCQTYDSRRKQKSEFGDKLHAKGKCTKKKGPVETSSPESVFEKEEIRPDGTNSPPNDNNTSETDPTTITAPSPIMQADNEYGFWKYFRPTYYFH